MLFFFWLVFAIAIAVAGDNRRIGFWPSLLWSIFLSPLIGAIITFMSPTKRELAMREEMHNQTMRMVKEKRENSIPDELLKLKNLADTGSITQDEYEAAKKKLLS